MFDVIYFFYYNDKKLKLRLENNMVDFPSQRKLEDAILYVLNNTEVTLSVEKLNNGVIEYLELPDEIVFLEDESGLGTKLNYRLRWARTSLKNLKMIENPSRGLWKRVEK